MLVSTTVGRPEFQQKQGLNATGQLDDQTLVALGVSASTTGQNTIRNSAGSLWRSN